MASVTSLDKDLRKLRAEKYTPQAAGEAKSWIESVLGEKLPQPDLLDALKDGVSLCKLVNKVLPPPGVKFKQSAMPFVQMENISIFLRACKAPPLNLLEHDVFLTVDLYERKDPAQVLQCIGAFSRAANAANPSAIPTVIGPKVSKSVISPQATGGAPLKSPGLPARNTSTASNATVSSFSSSFGSSLQPTASPLVAQKTGGSVASSRWGAKSPTLSATTPSVAGSVSSWSKKDHEGTTSPAWNIAQYGYMGGASQGTMGVTFGGRRQITTAAPHVPSVQEKERMRKEAEAEAERKRKEEEQRKKAEKEAAEERARQEEERRWEEETRKAREEERKRLEEEKRRWQEEERQWKLDQERRRKEEEEAERRLQAELKQEEEKKRAAEKQAQQYQQHTRERSDPRLRGQLLSQYQAEESRDKERIRELERELEKARRREAEYERERQERSRRLGVSSGDDSDEKQRSRSRPARPISRQDSWKPRDERRFSSRPPSPLVQDILDGYLDSPVQPAAGSRSPRANLSPRPLPDPTSPSRPLPIPANPMLSPPQKLTAQRTGNKENNGNGNGLSPALPIRPNHTGNNRPLPTAPLQPRQQPVTPTQPSHASNNKSPFNKPRSPYSPTQQKTGGFAALSLLEREMELERQRQREWEEAQQETAKAVRAEDGVNGIGGGIGGRWDVGQWAGFTGGDSQNRGTQGIGAGRRPIVGPRPLPNLPQ